MSFVIALSLLHFIWQGALIGAIAWVAMKLTRSANARYVIGVVALALMAAAPIMTASLRLPTPPPVVVAAPIDVPSIELPPTAAPVVATPTPWWTRVALTPVLAQRLLICWLLGVAFLSLRLFVGWLTARRLTRVGVSEPRLEILSHAERIMGALKIQHAVTVLESALVKVPMTMGWWQPVVLLPAAAMTGLSMEQIDALVAHELAHVRRHDYLVNLAQSAIETMLFYHPMVWVISRAVRHERELCCDDLAIAVCGGDTVTYASALADLESMRVAAPALAANGGSLLLRVKRILGHDAAAVSRSRTNWAAGVAIIVTAMLLVPMNVAKTRADERAQTEQGVVAGVKDAVTGGVTNGVTSAVATGASGGIDGGASAGAPAGVKEGVAGGVAGGIAGIDPLPPAIDFTRLTTERPTETVAVNAPPPQVSEPATRRTEKDVYESAWGAYGAGDFAQAAVDLQAFLRDFPRSSRADEAHYFIGVSQLNTQQYGDAVSAFSWLIANSPSSRLAPDAHYHRAQAHRALGKTSEAVSDLQVILRDFRDSTYAPLAKALLDRIQEVPAPQYFVQGFVKQPGQHQWEPGLTLERALEKAGGVTEAGARGRVKVTRQDPATKQFHEVDLGKEPLNFVIQPNDVIEIPKRRM